MNRLNQILIAVLAVQVVLAAVIFWPRSAASSVAGPLLPDVTAADVTNVVISDPDGNVVELARSGEGWVLPRAGDFPADGAKITPILDKLAGIKTNRLVTQTEASHKRLQVAADDFARLVELTEKDGAAYKLYLGSSAGASTTHVRADGRPEVYLTGDLSSWDVSAQASGWIDTLYYTVPQTATVALTLQNANGTFEFERQGETWTIKGLAEGETFSENNFSTLLGQVTSMQMMNPLGKEEEPAFGLDQPQAVVTLKTLEGDEEQTYTLQIGAQDEQDSSFIVKWSASPYYVQVASFNGTTFTDKTRDSFLQPPPTAEPTLEAPAGQ